jgi:hypothetical protein
MSDTELDPNIGTPFDKDGTFSEEDDLRLASHLLRILKEMMDAADKQQNCEDGYERICAPENALALSSSGYNLNNTSPDESRCGQFLVIIEKLKHLKHKASRAISRATQEQKEKWSHENSIPLPAEPANLYLVDLINQIAEAIARADGHLPHNITVGKGGPTRSTDSLPPPLDIGASPAPSPSASNIIIKLCRGSKQETSDAIKAVLAIYNESLVNSEQDDELGKISVLDLRKAGGLNLLLNALKRSQQQHWADVELQICKGISLVLTLSDEDPQLLLRNVGDILNVLYFTLCADKTTRSRTNSLVNAETFDKALRKDEVAKGSLSRQSTISSNLGSISSSLDLEHNDDFQRFTVARALFRICSILSQECKKLDQTTPLGSTASESGIYALGRVPNVSAPSLVRSDSLDSAVGGRASTIDRPGNVGRRRSLSGAKDNAMSDASKNLQLIIKIIQSLCNEGQTGNESGRSTFNSHDDIVTDLRYLTSQQNSQRGGLALDDPTKPVVNFSSDGEQSPRSINQTVAMCCGALCSLTEVPMFVPVLVDTRALVVFKDWMDLCSNNFQAARGRNTDSSADNPATLFAEQVCAGISNMLGSPSTAAMPNADRFEDSGRAPVAWMDGQIIKVELVKSIVTLIQCTVNDFTFPVTSLVRSALSRSTEQYLSNFLHQLCRRSYLRTTLFIEKTPSALAALFVNAVNRCKASKDASDLEFMEYMVWACLDGLTYFLIDTGSGLPAIDKMVEILSCSAFIESITFSLANLGQGKARLACLYLVSNLTEFSNGLEALVEGGAVDPLVVIAQSHMCQQKETLSDLHPPKLSRQSGPSKHSPSPSAGINSASTGNAKASIALASFNISSITTLAEYATRDRLTSSFDWFGRSAVVDVHSDDTIRSAKSAVRVPHSINRDGENPAVKVTDLNLTAANMIEESMTVCSALANISQHSLEYAARLYKCGLLGIMLKVSENHNPEVKRQALRCLGEICAIIPSSSSSFRVGISDQEIAALTANGTTRMQREVFYVNESRLHLEAVRVRRSVSHFDRDPENTFLALQVLSDALSSDNYMVQKAAMNGLAKLALSEDDIIKEKMFAGPLKLVCTLMMDTNHEEELRALAEQVLVHAGFSGGRDDFQLCSHDFSILKDWFNMRRWMEPQRLCYRSLVKWTNQIFLFNESGRLSPQTLNRPVTLGGGSTTPPRGIENSPGMNQTSSASTSYFSDNDAASPVENLKDFSSASSARKSMAESFAEMVGISRSRALRDYVESSATPWTLGPQIHYGNQDIKYTSEDVLPGGAMSALNVFYPSRMHQLFILDLLALGSEEDANKADCKVSYDSDGSVGTSGSAIKKNDKFFNTRTYLPNTHEVYAIGMPALNYHHINITSLARVIEKTISECSAHSPERLFALAFANSTFAEDSHVPFLACLHRVSQITALTFRESRTPSAPAGLAFASPPRQTKDSLGYLAGYVPSSIRFLTFQGCLIGEQVQRLCELLQHNNAAFKRHAEYLYQNDDEDDYDSDASTNSYSTYHSGKDASSTKDRSRNGRETKGRRWKYTKGIIGLALTHIPFGNVEVAQICKLLNPRGLDVDSIVPTASSGTSPNSGTHHRAFSASEEDEYSGSKKDGRGLKYLDLSENSMSDEQCARIMDAALLGQLEGLELGGNTPKPCFRLLESMGRMSQISDPFRNKLRHLGLQNAGLTVSTLCKTFLLLSTNTTLTSIDLSNNNCGESSELAVSISIFFERNKYLRSLDLSHNGFETGILRALEQGLDGNLTLVLMSIEGNSADPAIMREIRSFLVRNRRLYGQAAVSHQDRAASRIVMKERSRRQGLGNIRAEALDEEGEDDSIPNDRAGADTISEACSEFIPRDLSQPLPKSLSTASMVEALESESSIFPGKEAIGVQIFQVDEKISDASLFGRRNGLPIDAFRIGVSNVVLQPDRSFPGRSNQAPKFFESQNTDMPKSADSVPSANKGLEFAIEKSGNSPVITRQNSFANAAKNTLCVFFAAPLVLRERGGLLYPAGKPLPYNVERDAIIQVFKEVHRDNNVSFGFATTDTIRTAVTMGCRALHISGHGHPDFIWFEDGLAGLQMVSKDSLRNLLSAGNASIPDFVFISACHSESTAAAFVELGVKHVVCVKVDMQIQDSLAVVFTRAFYLALLSGNTVKQAFDIGKEAVSTSPYVRGGSKGAELESSKFILLPALGSHEESIFSGKRTSKWPSKPYHCVHGFVGAEASDGRNTAVSMTSPGSKFVPAPPVDFIGREVDMYRIIRDISKQRFVTLTGVPGVGKSSLACAACTYMADRRLALLEDGVLFLKAKGICTYEAFLEAMRELLFDRNMISSHLRDRFKKMMLPGRDDSSASDDDDDFPDSAAVRIATEKIDVSHSGLEKRILRFFVPLRMLLVLDHIDEMVDVDDLRIFLASLLHDCPAVKVLAVCTQTSRMLLLPNHGVTETTCGVDNLTLKNTLRLFARMSPMLKTLQDKEAFVKHILGKQDPLNPQHNLTLLSRGITSKSIGIFRALGNGHPATIIKLAHESTAAKFSELVRLATD